MRIAIPVESRNDLNSDIYGHFGSAPYYAIYDDESEKLFFIENDEKIHVHGQCQPTAELLKNGVSAVICTSLGMRAILNLNHLGIKVYYGGEAKTISDLAGKIKNHDLEEFNHDNICRQHLCH